MGELSRIRVGNFKMGTATSPCFAFPIPVTKQKGYSEFVSPTSFLCSRLKSTSQNPKKKLSFHNKRPAIAQWQQTLLPSDESIPKLEQIYSSFPTRFAQAFVLGVDATKQFAFITAHYHRSARRPAAPPSSYALPIPLSCPTNNSFMLLHDALTHIYAIPESSSQTFLPASASSVTSLIPSTFCHYLGINHITANDIITSYMFMNLGSVRNRARFLEVILHICGVKVAATALIEVESNVRQNQMNITGVVYVQRHEGSLFGERLLSDVVAVEVEPDFALSLATTVECECFIETIVFSSGSVHVNDMTNIYASYGYKPVVAETLTVADEEFVQKSERNNQGKHIWITNSPIWQWNASDVMLLSEDELRNVLREQDIGVRQNESKESLLAKVSDLMDEVHRRELGIMLAAKAGMYGLAAELQRGRSKRGRLVAELRELEQNGRWSEVARVAEQIKRLEAQTHDITLEPGSYNPDLDQDEWYRPCR